MNNIIYLVLGFTKVDPDTYTLVDTFDEHVEAEMFILDLGDDHKFDHLEIRPFNPDDSGVIHK